MLGVFNSAAFLTSGQLAVAAGATITVRRESDSGLAAIYSDRAGSSAITNPSAFADPSGRFVFYAAQIEEGYSIEVTSGAENYMIRNVQVSDPTNFGISLVEAANAAAARLLIGLAAIAAKGDSWWGSAADTIAKLTVGTNGKVLIADSTATPGVTWGDIPLPAASISGLTYANNSGDATNDIDIAAGAARSSDNTENLVLAAAITKQLDAAWAVGTAAGGLDTGSIGNSDYYIHLIKRVDTGVVDVLFSLSATAPTMPADYTVRRLIGWFKRVGGTIVAFETYEASGGGLELSWDVPTLDVDLASTLTTSRRTDAVKVPLNFSVMAHMNVNLTDGAGTSFAWIGCPDQTDAAPSVSAAPLANTVNYPSAASHPGFYQMRVRTSATGTIAARANVATIDSYRVSTMGFEWGRRNAL